MLQQYYTIVGDRIENAGGKVVKFMGDSALLFFSADRVDEGVEALIALQEEGDAWLHDRGFASRQIIKAHFGSLCCGLIGTRTEKRFDVFGQTVCIAATMRSDGLALSAQAFRKLSPATRKAFKKHTPPVTYIPIGQRH